MSECSILAKTLSNALTTIVVDITILQLQLLEFLVVPKHQTDLLEMRPTEIIVLQIKLH